jgi:tetratricopeptide (TPR) repeat protein
MTAIASIRKDRRPAKGAVLLWTAALIAAGLAIAVALVATQRDGSGAATVRSAADEAAAREARIAFFEQRAAADPIDFLSLNALTGQYLQRARETGDVADYRRAEAAATKSLDLVPVDNYGGLIGLAAVRLVQHDFAAVESLANDAMALKPYEAAPYGLLADAQVGLGRYDEASDTLAAMVEIEAGLPALSRLAHLAFLRGDELNAVEFWRQAIEAGEVGATATTPVENLAWAHVQLGVTYFALGDLDKADSQHAAALSLFPDYVHALAALGQVRAAEQRWDQAAALYERAVARMPQPQYVAALGDVYAVAGREAEAAGQYALVEAIAALYRDGGINTDLQIALFYADHDLELPLALEMARATFEAAPGVYAADALAWALYKKGEYEDAAAFSEQARAWGTPEAGFYFHAALISHALGDDDTAREQLQRALDLNPRFAPLQAEQAQALQTELEASR